MSRTEPKTCSRCGARLFQTGLNDYHCPKCFAALVQLPGFQPADVHESSQTGDRHLLSSLGLTDDFEILEKIGEGGFGVVHRARQRSLDRIVAIKSMRPDCFENTDQRQRFEREARMASSLSHPNVCAIYQTCHGDDGQLCLVMEYVGGQSIPDILEQSEMSVSDALHIALSVSEALEAIHEIGMIHRDIKTSNLRLDRWGNVKILDFGLAKNVSEFSTGSGENLRVTQTGTFLGSPQFVSPEQALGEPLDERTDIFSLGIVLYELLTGHLPFDDERAASVLNNVINKAPPPVTHWNRKLPETVARIVSKCLEKQREGRYRNAAELSRALKEQLETQPPQHQVGEPALQQSRLITLLSCQCGIATNIESEASDLGPDEAIEIIRQRVLRFAGSKEISTTGSSVLMSLETPSNAAHVAISILLSQQRNRNETLAGNACGIGIHMFEAPEEVMSEESWQRQAPSLHKKIATRLSNLAIGGRLLMSRSVFDLARCATRGANGDTRDDICWMNRGSLRLDGISEPVELGEVLIGEPQPDFSLSADWAKPIVPEGEASTGWRPAIGAKVPNTSWFLEQRLGEGGSGEVWLGKNQALDAHRVFKFCYRNDQVRFLKREATLFRLLRESVSFHPHIIQLLDVCFDEPPFYIVMEHVDAVDLKQWSDQEQDCSQIPLETRLEIVAQTATALQSAHEMGVLHRDIKPSNILIGKDPTNPANVHVWIADFGIGHVTSADRLEIGNKAGFTQTLGNRESMLVGTHAYLAPELFTGKPASSRSDVFSLGILLYQLWTADLTRPLTADWESRVADSLLIEDLRLCLASDPELRLSTPGELAQRIRRLPERRIQAQRSADLIAAGQRAAYRRGIARASLAASVILAIIAFLALAAGRQSRLATEREKIAQRNLYAAEITAAGLELGADNLGRAIELLKKTRPARGDEDLRGWEWRFLWGQCISDETLTLSGHTGPVTSAFFWPQNRILSAGVDGSLKLWSLGTYEELHATPLAGGASAMSALPSHGRVAASFWHPDWQIIQFEPEPSIQTITHSNVVKFVLFSPRGQRVAITDFKTLDVWDLPSKRVIQSFPDGVEYRGGLAFSTDGSRIAYATRNRTVTLRDVATGENSVVIETGDQQHSGDSSTIALSPDGKTLATGHWDGILTLIDVQSGHVIQKRAAHTMTLYCMEFSPSGSYLATGSADQTIKIWDTRYWKLLATLNGHTDLVHSLSWSADETSIVSSGKDAMIKTWALSDQGVSTTLPHLTTVEIEPPHLDRSSPKSERTNLAIRDSSILSADGSGFATHGRDGAIWDLQTRTRSPLLIPEGYQILAVGQRGASAIARSPSQEVRLYNSTTAPIDFAPETGIGRLEKLTLSPNSMWIAGIGPDEDLRLLSRPPDRINQVLDENSTIASLAFSRDDQILASGSHSGRATFWNLRTSPPIKGSWKAHQQVVRTLAISPDNKSIATGGLDGRVRIWSLKSPHELLGQVGKSSIGFVGLAFSPDGRRLATVPREGMIQIWDSATFLEVGRFRVNGHPQSLHFLQDNDTLICELKNPRQLVFFRAPTFTTISQQAKAPTQPTIPNQRSAPSP